MTNLQLESRYKVLPNQSIIDTQDRKIILPMRHPERITNVFPKHKIAPYGDRSLVAVPLHEDTITLLRNLGYRTAGMEPIRHVYDWPKVRGRDELRPHQRTTAAWMVENPRGYNLSTPRTGKTASMIAGVDYLQHIGVVHRTLVVCLVSNMDSVWQDETFGMLGDRSQVVIVHGKNKQERREQLNTPAHYYVINPDGIKLMLPELQALVNEGYIDCVILDEITKYATNAQSQTWKALNTLVNKGKRQVRYLWGLTGTPGDPEQIYGQVKLVTPNKMAMSFTTWRDHVMTKINTFKWVPRTGWEDIVRNVMQPSIRFDKKDIMDLPPVSPDRERSCALSKEQQKAYDEMVSKMVSYASSGEEIKAINQAGLTTKLLQIAGGVVKAGDEIVELDCTPRIDAMEEIIKESTSKVVVFCAYTAVMRQLSRELQNRGYTTAIVDGSVSRTQRGKIFRSFQADKDPQIIIAHPITTAFGVELSAADTMVFYGPPLSGNFIYQQAIERLSSLSQQANMIYLYHLAATKHERKLFRQIVNGVDQNQSLVDLFNDVVNEFTT